MDSDTYKTLLEIAKSLCYKHKAIIDSGEVISEAYLLIVERQLEFSITEMTKKMVHVIMKEKEQIVVYELGTSPQKRTSKICSKCNQEKDFSEFTKTSRPRSPFYSRCKECQYKQAKLLAEKRQERFEQNREQIMAQHTKEENRLNPICFNSIIEFHKAKKVLKSSYPIAEAV